MKSFILNVTLIGLFVAELCFQYLPHFLHELLGIVTAIVALVHVIINRKRFLVLINQMSVLRLFCTEVNLSLILCTTIILLSGLCISNHLLPDLVNSTLHRNTTIHNLHTMMPYIMIILIGIHIGLHWREIRQKILKLFGKKELSKLWQFFFDAMVLMLSVFGILSLNLNRFLDRILMEHVFSTPATDLPVAVFILLLIGTVTLFAAITFIVVEKFFKQR